MAQFPAILIGGPPHSGKSVLTYSLTQALRQQGIQHYVIRAAPDGEGDWSNEAEPALVRALRHKGDFTADFTEFVCQSIRNRHLPLLVDVGGRPTPEQERIFACCTHAILLTPDETSRTYWRQLVQQHGLPRLADFISTRQGAASLSSRTPVLEGQLTALERHQTARGPAFEALVEHVAALFAYQAHTLVQIHEQLCAAELVVDVSRLARTFAVSMDGAAPQWQPYHLAAILNYLPAATPLGLYGRAPNWLCTAIALHCHPAPFFQFDPRLGWVRAQPLALGAVAAQPLHFQIRRAENSVYLTGKIQTTYLDYAQLAELTAPPLSSEYGLVLGGKLPNWLYTSLACTYPELSWIAVYQPQLQGAVVVRSTTNQHAVGDYLPDVHAAL